MATHGLGLHRGRDNVTSFSQAEQLVGLPGYLATMRLVRSSPGGSMFRPAWAKLELFPTAAAADFLSPKLEKALAVADAEARMDALIEINLGFAIMAVHADRENNAFIEEMAQRAASADQTKKIEDDIENEAVSPTEIDW